MRGARAARLFFLIQPIKSLLQASSSPLPSSLLKVPDARIWGWEKVLTIRRTNYLRHSFSLQNNSTRSLKLIFNVTFMNEVGLSLSSWRDDFCADYFVGLHLGQVMLQSLSSFRNDSFFSCKLRGEKSIDSRLTLRYEFSCKTKVGYRRASTTFFFLRIDTPIGLKAIEHFRIPLSLLFKASLSEKLWRLVQYVNGNGSFSWPKTSHWDSLWSRACSEFENG